MVIDIDESAGFCRGVRKTVEIAEQAIAANPGRDIYILGELIHNPAEVRRLAEKGLRTIGHEDIKSIDPVKSVVIIRAHGEPPETYELLKQFDVEYVDTTCSIVSSLHETIARYFKDGYNIIIFGNRNHPEVIGLLGSCDYKAVVVGSAEEATSLDSFSARNLLISQTTKSKKEFDAVREIIQSKMEHLEAVEPGSFAFDIKDTTCRYVNRREKQLTDFVVNHQLIVFVAGRNSSNGRMLFELCRSLNGSTIFVEDSSELEPEMIRGRETIGITGATSTPGWQLEEVRDRILELAN